MRRVHTRRRGFIDLHRVTLGDYVVLAASLLTLISLFMPWWTSPLPGSRDQWAFTYSEWTSVIVIVFFLAVLFLVVYPALSTDLHLPRLPFATPVIFLTMGTLLLLMYTYELGKYGCVNCPSTRGWGIWLGWFAAIVFIVGAIIRWGSRPAPRRAG